MYSIIDKYITMRQFVSDAYHYIISIVMMFPVHCMRISFLRFMRMKIGKHTAICRGADIRTPYRVSIGSYTTINKHVVLDGRGGLIIGDCVDIAQEVNIWSLQHDYNNPTYATKSGKVVIEDYAWIASRVTVLPGVTIGRGAVVGACSVVTKNIPSMCIAVGNPAKVIGKREECLKYKLGQRGWFK